MRNSHAFEHVAATVLGSGVTLTSGDVPEMIDAGRVTSDYFAVFNVQPAIGRTFSADEDAPGGRQVAVLSHKLWMSHFNGDPTVVGRALQLDGVAHTVIGIMPASFDLTGNSEDLWLPMAITPQQMAGYGEHFIQIIARLPAGVSIEQARSRAHGSGACRSPSTCRNAPSAVSDVRGRYPPVRRLSGRRLQIAVVHSARRRGLRPADRLHQRGEPAARARQLARQGARHSRGARRRPRSPGAPAAHREPCARRRRRTAWPWHWVRVASRHPRGEPGGRATTGAGDNRLARARLHVGIALFSCLIFGLFPAVRAAGLRLQGTLREGGGDGAAARGRSGCAAFSSRPRWRSRSHCSSALVC